MALESDDKVYVLILVLMEYGLWQKKAWAEIRQASMS